MVVKCWLGRVLAGMRAPRPAPSSQEQVCGEVRGWGWGVVFLFTAACVEKLVTTQLCCPGLSVFKYWGYVFML